MNYGQQGLIDFSADRFFIGFWLMQVHQPSFCPIKEPTLQAESVMLTILHLSMSEYIHI
jgi:hypothetical protein